MIRWLAAGLLLMGCTDERQLPASDRVTPVPGQIVEVSVPFRDSVATAFVQDPDSVLARMTPGAGPDDVRIAAALMETAHGEAKLQFVHYAVNQGARAVPALVSVIERSNDWQTLVSTIQTLGKMKAASSVTAVSQHLHTPNNWVRMAAAHALGEMNGDLARQALVSALADTADTVVSAALVGLGKLGERSATLECARLLDHDNPRVRAAAVSAIGRLGRAEDALLLDRLREDPDSGVRYKVGQAVARIRAGTIEP